MDHEVIVVGAGQAGLALGYFLSRRGLDFCLLDGAERVGDAWRTRWDSLRLFTPARYNALPGAAFVGDPDAFPGKDEVADYLEAYATRFELPVQLQTRVRRLARDEGGFALETSRGLLRAPVVVVATGSHAVPITPKLAERLSPDIRQINACTYRNPACLPDGPTLVVGAGNSGAQIALELVRSRPTTLAGPRVGAVPARILGVDVFRLVDHLGVMRWRVDSPVGRRIVAASANRADPLVGMTRRDLAAAGIALGPRVDDVRDGLPVLSDGSVVDVRSVVWCCGIRPNFGWIDDLRVDERGSPLQRGGAAEGIDDLFFGGLRFQQHVGSGTLGGVGRDAELLSDAIEVRVRRLSGGACRRATPPGDRARGRSGGRRASA